METKTLTIDKIKPNAWNPNEMVDSTFNYLIDSKNWFGDLQDIVVWQTDEDEYIIIDGEHRWKADRKLGKTDVLCKVLTTEDLLKMGDKMVALARENPEFQSFTKISNINNKKEKAEFIAKSLTIVMNAIKGENNPVKLARLYTDMESLVEDSEALTKLLHITEDELKSYKTLLEMADNEEDVEKLLKLTQKPEINEVKLILDNRQLEVFEIAVGHTGIGDKTEATISIFEDWLKEKNIDFPQDLEPKEGEIDD